MTDFGQMQASICSPSRQSHLTTASPHHCGRPTRLFPPRHGGERCLQHVGKLYALLVCSTHKPPVILVTCFPTESPFQANLINIISISQIRGAVLHCQCTQNPAGPVGVGTPGSVGLPRQTANNSLLFSLYGFHPLRLSYSTFNQI